MKMGKGFSWCSRSMSPKYFKTEAKKSKKFVRAYPSFECEP